jgi:hypothetical protein
MRREASPGGGAAEADDQMPLPHDDPAAAVTWPGDPRVWTNIRLAGKALFQPAREPGANSLLRL